MATHRYYGVKKFTQVVIDAHNDGKPFVPAGCKGNIQLIYYDDEVKPGFTGSVQAFGTMIKAVGFSEYVFTLNSLLDKGAEIKANTAAQIGTKIMCSYTIPIVKEEKETAEDLANKMAEIISDSIEEIPALSDDTLATIIEPFVAADAELLDWNHAESLLETDRKCGPKQALKEYAATFGIKLNKAQKFENMMKHFKAEVEGYD